LKRFCKRVGIEYRSPHGLRHGHGVYIAKISATYEEFKAYSQNMGHETTEITEKYYSRFANKDVKRIVTRKDIKERGIFPEMDEETLREFEEFKAYKYWRENYR
jgi:integrase